MRETHHVWSLFIRIFHWSLVVLFVLAYYTSTSGDDDLHAICGYMITGLLILRVLYGFFSSGYAKFTNFLYSPAKFLQHGKQIIENKPEHYIGHSPMGAYMVFSLLLLLLMLVVTGLISQGWTEYEGPLWAVHMMPNDALGRWSENMHEALPDMLIGFIILHISGVFIACRQHNTNLVRVMITGKNI